MDLNQRLASEWQDFVREGYESVVLVHGDAPGVDKEAAAIWESHGLPTEPHPADWSRGGRAGPERNARMVALGADRCIAFPIHGSKGTIDCMLKAAAAGIPTEVFGRPS